MSDDEAYDESLEILADCLDLFERYQFAFPKLKTQINERSSQVGPHLMRLEGSGKIKHV